MFNMSELMVDRLTVFYLFEFRLKSLILCPILSHNFQMDKWRFALTLITVI